MPRILLALVLLTLAMPTARAADPVKLPKELALVPNDALAFVSVNVAEAGNLPAFGSVRNAVLKAISLTDAVTAVGLKIEDVERHTIIVLRPAGLRIRYCPNWKSFTSSRTASRSTAKRFARPRGSTALNT